MAQALHKHRLVAKGHSAGFTLVELMVVVVIVGVLAMLAVVGYRKLVQSAHVSEATGMVNNIRVAQEAYHAETQQYANISPDLVHFYPRATPAYGVQTAWGAACGGQCTSGMDWSQLPLHVDGPVLFGYATVAGQALTTPPTLPTGATEATNCNFTYGGATTPDWYMVAARADLDGDSSTYTTVCATSWTHQVFVVNDGQ
jgi:type IV pilus assembly protein PilA